MKWRPKSPLESENARSIGLGEAQKPADVTPALIKAMLEKSKPDFIDFVRSLIRDARGKTTEGGADHLVIKAKRWLDEGLGLEPFELLRALPVALDQRHARCQLTKRVSPIDRDFLELAQEGDRQRDRHSWEPSERAYHRALQLYPFHDGYKIQYGHVLKELGRVADAELQYRDALAVGGDTESITEHIDFLTDLRVAPRFNKEKLVFKDDDGDDGFSLTATSDDFSTLSTLILNRDSNSPCETLRYLQGSPSRRELMIALFRSKEFINRNRDLIEVLHYKVFVQ